MTTLEKTTDTADPTEAPIWNATRRRIPLPWRSLGENRPVRHHAQVLVVLCGIWIAAMVIVALTAQWLPIADPTKVLGTPNVNPVWGREFLGLDGVGRSMISRLAFGARVSIEISFAVTLLSFVVGGAIGVLAAYFGSTVNVVANVIVNAILSVPGLLMLLTLVIVLKPTIPVLILTISLIYFPGFMRLMRANTLAALDKEYLHAARGLGASHRRIIVRELLPNASIELITYFALIVPNVMLTEGSLSYLGFGVQTPKPSWGQMIAQGQQQLTVAPWQVVIPCLVFTLTVFAFYVLGDWMRARIDVRGLASV